MVMAMAMVMAMVMVMVMSMLAMDDVCPLSGGRGAQGRAAR